MTMFLEVNNRLYENFTGASASIRLDSLSNTFSFGATGANGVPLPFKIGDRCKVRIDNDLIITGSIEVLTVDYSDSSHSVSLMGRDKTGDLLDSTIDVLSDIFPPIALEDIIKKVINHIGSDMGVVSNFSPKPFDVAISILSSERGQNAFEFIEKLARQKQVLLTSDEYGNIVIERSQAKNFTGGVLQNVLNSSSNNILSSSVSYDNTGRYNSYVFASQRNPITSNKSPSTSVNDIILQEGSVIDPEIRRGRQLTLVSESLYSSTDDDSRAKWEANIRRSRGRIYRAKVSGHKINGNMWKINTLVNINDVFAGISGRMLLNSIDYNYDTQSGSTTSLEFLEKNSYTLSLEEPKTDKLGLI